MSQLPDRRRLDDGRYANDRRMGRERRQGPDLAQQLLRVLAALSWLLVLAAFFLISLAKPQTETFFERYNNLPVQTQWNAELLVYVFWLLLAAILCGGLGLGFNLLRLRRRDDSVRLSLVLAGLLSLLGLLWFLRL
ncbi:MAG: hypothetical protein AB7T15_03190 [Desulfuromonas sp.]|jgi:hypothetical protein|uniref:hypothetical protein n=1 Tax=Desulfuromonas thiophila TaxID=57664 RepID=UPI0024A91D7C|nr:hypothetical protein [Desulfuromonas thiophila]MCK9172711.1 hypothetical protein [Desulfuromonas thiophila]MDD3802715.1 hypothetical protein [Desulfuromonas thiophila]MDY0397546.1 hypothetical protein [Desulfuromonas thiophila]